MAETTNNTKRNVFGSNHQKELRGLQSEHRTVGQFHCSATAAYWQGSEITTNSKDVDNGVSSSLLDEC